MRIFIVLIAGLALSQNALAEPVYIDCTLDSVSGGVQDAEPISISIILDEESGQITHTKSDGSRFKTAGFFSANEIAYKHVKEDEKFVQTDSYRLNRSTLEMVNEWTEKGIFAMKPIVRSGVCTIVQTDKRKI